MDFNQKTKLRDNLLRLLNLRCVFPCNLIGIGNVARCMLEIEGNKSLNFEDTVEDVIVKILDPSFDKDSVKLLISKLFSKIPTFKESPQDHKLCLELKCQSTSLHPGVASIIKIYENECGSIIIQSYGKHSMLSLSRFHARTTLASPTLGRAAGDGARDQRLRFIIYQLLQAVAFVHEQGLCLDTLTPGSVMLDDSMWVTLPIGTSERSYSGASILSQIRKWKRGKSVGSNDEDGDRQEASSAPPAVQSDGVSVVRVQRPVDYYEPLTVRWANGKVSNFEYLMAVNYAAGRSMADPLYHPILPWVTDFTHNLLPCQFHESIANVDSNPDALSHSASCTPCSHGSNPEVLRKGFRDLTRTKFRLSKGDHQLETTFRHSDPSHHVPESLSELTYYIYMARRTPMQVLRRVVRDVFVPEHYPISMARMFDWSPDECIPEFYSDPSVFESIHKEAYGLPDLEFPHFISSPAAFILYHRAVLESDEVSSKIHHWLDLTFGHCLRGQAAIDNMNVPLRHTLSAAERTGDSPKLDKHPGFVMLFDKPHPRRHVRNFSCEYAATAPNFELNTRVASSISAVTADGNSLCDTMNLAVDLNPNLNLARDLQALVDIGTGTSRRSSMSASKYLAASGNSFNSAIASSVLSASVPGGQSASGSSGVPVEPTYSSGSASTGRSTQVLGVIDSRKSLSHPQSDSSLLCLQVAGSIDVLSSLNSDFTSKMDPLVAISDEYRFANEFGTLLEPAYSLPDASVISSHAKSRDTRPQFWDSDFQQSIVRASSRISPPQAATGDSMESEQHEIERMQADDMFAVGCVLAEVFLEQPVLSKQDAARLQTDTGTGDDEKDRAFQQINNTLAQVYRNASTLPLGLRRLVCLLLQPDVRLRPRAKEVLQACAGSDHDTWQPAEFEKQCFGGSEPGVVDFSVFRNTSQRSHQARPPKMLSSGPVVELLDEYCTSVFPSYFKGVYTLVGRIRLCRKDSSRIKVILDSLEELRLMPLEGLSLALPHLMTVLADPRPFRSSSSIFSADASSPTVTNPDMVDEETGTSANQSSKELKESKDEKHLESLIRQYALIIDVIGARLGLEGTEKLLVPPIVNFLNKLMSPQNLQLLLDSTLWSVVIVRAGVCSFLRHFLPALLTYSAAGTLQRVSKANLLQDGGSSPLWTNLAGAEHYEWLHACTMPEIRSVQMAAVATIINLTDPIALGHGLTTRYVVPALLCLVAVPNLSAAGYGVLSVGSNLREFLKHHNRTPVLIDPTSMTSRSAMVDEDRPPLHSIEGRPSETASDDEGRDSGSVALEALKIESKEDLMILDKFISSKAEYDPQDMFVVRCIVGLCVILGDLVTAEVVISKIFNCILPELQKSLVAPLTAPVTSALMEIILLLNGILPTLSPAIVIKSLLMPAKSSGLSLPSLLVQVPLAPSWCVLDDTRSMLTSTDLESYIDCQRNHILHLELCRLVVSSSMIAGPQACEEFVLPSLDLFFSNFVEAFGSVAIESRTMWRAFELGSELFLPLAQFVGPESFYTTVSNLNPRLEMWLLSVGSGGVRTSPPLPPNILPEVVQTNNGADKSKKKGLFQWISSKSSWKSTFSNLSSSNSSTNAPQSPSSSKPIPPNVAVVAAKTPAKSKIPSRAASVDTFAESRSKALHSGHPAGGPNQKTASHTLDTKTIYEPDSLTDDFVALSPVSDRPTTAIPHNHLFATPGALPVKPTGSTGMELKQMPAPRGTPHHGAAVPSNMFTPNPHDRHVSNVASPPDDSSNGDGSVPGDAEDREGDSKVSEGHFSPMRTVVSDDPDFDSDDDDYEYDPSDEQPLMRVRPEVATAKKDGDRHTAGIEDFGVSFPGDGDLPSVAAEGTPIKPHHEDEEEKASMEAPNLSGHSDLQSEDFELDSERAVSMEIMEDSSALQGDSVQNIPLLAHKKIISSGFSSTQWISKKREKKSKVTLMLSSKPTSAGEDEEEEAKEMGHNDQAWLLAGKGRWNIAREVRAKKTKELKEVVSRGGADSAAASKRLATLNESYSSSDNSWAPAAQLSMTSPRIAVDVASEAASLFAFGMTCRTQWRVEESSPIRAMAIDNAEMFLLTSSKSGVKIFSLNSHPLKQVSQYTAHSSTPFCASFMRSGLHVASCDGNINLWDIEHGKTLSVLEQSAERGAYSFMEAISPRIGITPSLNAYGDDQLLTCQGSSLIHYDFRVQSKSMLKGVSEWIMPPLPITYSNFSSNVSIPVQLTCAASTEKLIVAGSSSGGLWAVDRRMGRVLSSWQGHEGSAVVKVSVLDERSFLSIADRSAYVWSCTEDSWNSTFKSSYKGTSSAVGVGLSARASFGSDIFSASVATGFEMARTLTLRNTPDGSTPLLSSAVMLHTFEQSSSSSHGMDIGIPSKPLNVLYCVCGHKMYAGRIPTGESSQRNQPNFSTTPKEGVDADEIKLTQTYFSDRNKVKLPKQKLHATSSVMLPLRRLLLLGTEDGLVRVVS